MATSNGIGWGGMVVGLGQEGKHKMGQPVTLRNQLNGIKVYTMVPLFFYTRYISSLLTIGTVGIVFCYLFGWVGF